MTGKKSNIRWRNVIIFLVVAVGLIALAQYFIRPDMVGWTIDRVKIYENGNDIKILYQYEFTEDYDYGIVMAQKTCESSEPCDVILIVSIGEDVSRQPEQEIINYLDSLVERGLIQESQIQMNSPEHSNDINKGFAKLYRPAPSEGMIEVTISLGPEITVREASMVAVGDILLHDTVYQAFEAEDGTFDFSPLFADIRRYIEPSLFAFVNQETNIGGEDIGLASYPNFNSPFEIARDLIEIGFNMFSRANNHTLDKGAEAIISAEEYWLKFEDIITAGSTDSQEKRDEIAVIERNGIRIALLAYSYGFNGHYLPEGQEYLANLFSYEQAQIDIEKAQEVSDVVVVSMHWGAEYEMLPGTLQKEQAQWLADQGVDIILGTHPHVLQPVEFITGKSGNETLVAYSLGNFVSGQVGLEKNVGGILRFDIQKISIRDEVRIEFRNVELMPTYNFFDQDEKIYRLIPLIESTEHAYFETIQTLFETYSNQVRVVESLIEDPIGEDKEEEIKEIESIQDEFETEDEEKIYRR